KWVEDRNKNGYKSKYLYLHILVHFFLLLLFFINELQAVLGYIFLITASHFLIDLGKIYLEKTSRYSQLGLFLIDQLLHVAVLFGVVLLQFPELSIVSVISLEKVMLYAIALL